MPLRKLFKEIPTLLQKLKPCFMMSPLSVSYFLDSEMYQFDMVIFDEASQILPEDAIGAIYRGKQVVIAGDTKQMPPTNFFSAASKNNDDLYDSEEEDDLYVDVVSESILDEANICLPTCTLLWHYRSKDESLIAFSNRLIYGDKLITFPNCGKVADRGLEYVYVRDGFYEGMGKNCNIREAARCVRLVEEHILNHPERSLGIIAFSEKQQSVIEDAITQFRLTNPLYEAFFDETKEEPFFVKNLENVQGDERDTIIFSICYAKNKEGRMYMRFGPLGHAGGERRLNVAITRAKYNVKLVGSILPTDIDLSKTDAEGVRLLREYIYYAMENDNGIQEGAGAEYGDDLFPEIIADFVREKGYSIRRNIGASKYKIDIAVISPHSAEVFCAGIECDGSNYSMARTARDRDVLRKEIMSLMGWRICHAWSVSWHKNPEEEKRKLLAFLEEASENARNIGATTKAFLEAEEPDFPEAPSRTDISYLTNEVDTTSTVNELPFAEYRCCNPWDRGYDPKADNMGNLCLRIMYVLEHEQPIHKELLYRRLATVLGNQKATALVRQTIDTCLSGSLKHRFKEKNGFLYLTGNQKILPRRPKTQSDIRSIEYICPEEIQEAMLMIVELALGLSPDDLIAETARAFGFARTGAKIKQILLDTCEQLLELERLKQVDGKIYAKGRL